MPLLLFLYCNGIDGWRKVEPLTDALRVAGSIPAQIFIRLTISCSESDSFCTYVSLNVRKRTRAAEEIFRV